jgi:glutamate-1-semialdehyde 2,1-aminomutase
VVTQALQYLTVTVVALIVLRKAQLRLLLSRAKHPSLRGHAKLSRLVARLVPMYEFDSERFFACDDAPDAIVEKRKAGFQQLCRQLGETAVRTNRMSAVLETGVSDLQFTNANRVPFQFRGYAGGRIRVGAIAVETSGVRIRDLDGNWSYDLGGSYGVNLFGYDFYKECIERGVARAKELGPVLGPYHPLIAENVEIIRSISGQDEVSFHMSGTESVMQAVRLARFHTRRKQLVVFCGAYHGWWDGVQAGVGHRRSLSDVYMLKDSSDKTLHVLRKRRDIACVLVNPLQALHPNVGAGSDAMLVCSDRRTDFNRQKYAKWLQDLRRVCTERGIVLIFDEVFVGFRLGLGGAQDYFGVRADLVTYGKTIGGGLPIGVLAGRADLMKRYRDDRPADVCFARGTFNSHPYVMTTMNEFLNHVTCPESKATLDAAEECWNERARRLNERLQQQDLPVRVENFASIWVVTYTAVSRYNWMLQYYLRAEGLSLSWVGTARLIFSHNYSDEDFAEVVARFVHAAARMEHDGWWSQHRPATNASIRKEVLGELLASKFGWRNRRSPRRSHRLRRAEHAPSDRPVHPAANAAVISSKSESR